MSNDLKIKSDSSSIHLKASKEEMSPDHAEAGLPTEPIDLSGLMTYLKPEFQTDDHRSSAKAVAELIFESNNRSTGKDGGLAFPMNPEILAYAMQLARDETVLEIAGARGENAVLLAFGGAKHVYMNDINPNETKSFKFMQEHLPNEVKQKLELVEGDCFDLLKKKPEMTNKLGLVLCRNLIHFFDDEKQSNFFQLLNQMLKPGGYAIFTANTIYSSPNNRQIFLENPHSTCFKISQCLLSNFQSMELYPLLQEASIDPNGIVSSQSMKKSYIYSRNLGGKWTVDNQKFNELDPALRPKIRQAINDCKSDMRNIKHGNVQVLENRVRLYSKSTLSDLFLRHGFEVELTFAVEDNGHLIDHRSDENKLFELGAQVGVIVRKP